MTGDVCALGTLLAGSRPTVAATVQDLVTGSRATAAPVTVQGPGGTGKSVLLGELAAAHGRRGVPVLELDDVPCDDDGAVRHEALPERCAVLVDDAHQLTPAAARSVGALLYRPGVALTLAFRPWPRPAPLVRLVEGMTARRSVVLGHADRPLVLSWARELLGDAVPAELVDAVTAETGGLPGLVHPMLHALAARRRGGLRSIGTGRDAAPAVLVVPDEVVDRARAGLAALDEGTAALLAAVAAGAPVDEEVLGEVLHRDPDDAGDLVARARATGLLLPDGTLVPLIRRILLAVTPADSLRSTRRRLLRLLLDRGEEPLALARTLAADHVRDVRAAQLLQRQGEAALADDPGLASRLLEEAVSSGAPIPGLAAQRAQAAALTGDLDGALRWADAALADADDPNRACAAGVTAAVLARRGLLRRAADLYRLAGRERSGSTAVALLATGAREEALEVLSRAATAEGRMPTVLSVGEELMAQGVHTSLQPGADTAATAAAALSTLTRAAAVLEPVGRGVLLADTPAALAALVAVHSGELGVAESVLQRAVAADLGGPPSRPRHLLLLGWLSMLTGRLPRATDLLAEARGTESLEPRDDLFATALEVGIARRGGDVPGLARAWEHVPEALVRHPMDLFTLLPLGELLVAAARLEEGARLEPHVADAQALLERLGNPRLWATALHWSAAQAAILTDDPTALRPHAAELVGAARTSPYAAVLARAGRIWLRVLADDVDDARVVEVAQELAGVGLAWDGSRLAGQAAARAVEPRARAALLACARGLADVPAGEQEPPAGTPASCPSTAGALSDREREVARLVVAGQTYREIGGRLYISAKTVEHHVSRIRRRLGAGTRSDLVARLRAELAQGA
ncbi:helix-turn-helix transcriptional regulator [Blastococcus sp. TF02A-26]|uniref:helix-turn-helix transcriptional regulator n=1 Tax=Blastococcus sp. TF02A-26 TaxID=2250577 RepID=UPI000DE88DB5|nr:helix-turn-helix transcriptional regulator [Blastococcus sp. TF02A-26]RBY88692.1 LuxR family transcriptional regulator [Blastococcus sp. TF02A-26]